MNEFQASKICLKDSQFEQVFILELFKEMSKCFIPDEDNSICYNKMHGIFLFKWIFFLKESWKVSFGIADRTVGFF